MNKRRRYQAKRRRAVGRWIANLLSQCPRAQWGVIDDGEAEFTRRQWAALTGREER